MLQYSLLSIMLFLVCFLALEQIKLSFEINRLHANQENLHVEYQNFKDSNLKLITQFYTENSPAMIERQAKEDLGMVKQKATKIIIKNYEDEKN